MESSKGMKNIFAGYKKLKDVCWVHNDTTHRYRIQMWDGEQISKDQFAFLSLSNAFNMYVVRIVVHTSRNMWFLILECVCFYFVSCTKANFVITFLLRRFQFSNTWGRRFSRSERNVITNSLLNSRLSESDAIAKQNNVSPAMEAHCVLWHCVLKHMWSKAMFTDALLSSQCWSWMILKIKFSSLTLWLAKFGGNIGKSQTLLIW